jgi:hypothetical protein
MAGKLIKAKVDIDRRLIYTYKFCSFRTLRNKIGQVAQLVEQRTENPRVGGSTPSLATNIYNGFKRAPVGTLFSMALRVTPSE